MRQLAKAWCAIPASLNHPSPRLILAAKKPPAHWLPKVPYSSFLGYRSTVVLYMYMYCNFDFTKISQNRLTATPSITTSDTTFKPSS